MDSVDIIQSPPALALVGEGIRYQLQRVTSGITGKASLIVVLSTSGENYTDKYLTLGLYSNEIQFYFKASPDESGTQLRRWPVTGTTFAEFCAQVVEDLQQNYFLNKYYVVEVHASGIKLTAREVGSAYNIEFVGTNITGVSEGTNTAGVDDATASDYSIYAAVCLHNADPALPVPLGEEKAPVNDEEIAEFDFQLYLEDQLSSSFHFPFNGTLVYEVANAVIRYFIRYAEYYNSGVKKLYNDADEVHYAIAGGLNRIDSDFLNGEGSNYFDYNDNALRPLTWQPNSKVTYPATSERLFFFMFQQNGFLYKKDYYGTYTGTATVINEIVTEGNVILEIACGTNELFPDADISDLIKYEIWIEDDKGDKLMEVQTFVLDNTAYLNTRTLFFKNSFDMFDALHCTGDLTVKDDVTRDEKQVLSNYHFRRRVLLAENKVQYELNTGWLEGKDARVWLEEALLTEEMYLTLGDFLLPVIMTTGKVTRHQDREHNYSLKITFEPDYDNSRHSAIVGEGAYFYTDEDYVIYTDENGVRLIE